ncbi:unnamed protein product [Rhizophagus irregularis]|uniref:Protein kinase domain-containing protein n=1 Tax=Rhizophagus irregularis TaxID=588596 RepID=A0A915YUZ9_9GLOM|nr:unnamed protein product [Rhizophagus irregularis]CAB5342102.1 unnamed protein product [Rhizophagus irregularis]
MSNNTEINFQNERIVNRTETKGLNLSEIKGKNAIGPDETGTKDVFIRKGSYGSVFRANWKNSDQVFALKSFNNDETTLYQIINELKLHLNINHENILRFCGYTKIETDIVYQMSKYVLVLEYADSALQLANAVSHLHDNNVLHRDLHANNILIHKKNIKLADFGLVISINNGLREKSVDGTPNEYTKLYSECWNYEPDERPDMHQFSINKYIVKY